MSICSRVWWAGRCPPESVGGGEHVHVKKHVNVCVCVRSLLGSFSPSCTHSAECIAPSTTESTEYVFHFFFSRVFIAYTCIFPDNATLRDAHGIHTALWVSHHSSTT